MSVPFRAYRSIEKATGWRRAQEVVPTQDRLAEIENLFSSSPGAEGSLEVDVFRQVVLGSSETLALAVSATVTVSNGRNEICTSGQIWTSVGPTYPLDALARDTNPMCFEVKIVRDSHCHPLPVSGLRLLREVIEAWRAKALKDQSNGGELSDNDGPIWAVRLRVATSGFTARFEQFWVVQCDPDGHIDHEIAWPINNTGLRRFLSVFETLRPVEFECHRPYSKNSW